MKKIIDFDPSLRKDIESGKYEVETKNGRKATILDWERKSYGRNDLIVKTVGTSGESENVFYYYQDGRLISDSSEGPRNNDLVLVYEEEEKEDPPFSQYRPALESGELTATTEFGEAVEIVKWDCKGKYPILAVIDDGDTDDSCFYDIHGISSSGSKLKVHKKETLEFTKSLALVIREARGREDWIVNLEADSEMLYNLAKKGYIQGLKDRGKDGIIFKHDNYPEEQKPLENNGRPEIVDFNVPLSEEEFQVKREILQAIKNGKLSHIEIKTITGNLKKVLAEKEEKTSMWERATESMNVPGDGALVYRRLFGKDKIIITDRVRKGDVYCKLISLGTISENMVSRNDNGRRS